MRPCCLTSYNRFLEGTTPSEQQFLLPEHEITQGERYYVSAKSLWERRRSAHVVAGAGMPASASAPEMSSGLRCSEDFLSCDSILPSTLGFCHVSRGRGTNTGVCAVCDAARHGNSVTTLNIHPGSLVWMEDEQPGWLLRMLRWRCVRVSQAKAKVRTCSIVIVWTVGLLLDTQAHSCLGCGLFQHQILSGKFKV